MNVKQKAKPMHRQLAELEQRAERQTVAQIIGALQRFEVSVADAGDGEYIIVQPNNSKAGLAHALARWQLVERLHVAQDEEDGHL